MDVRTGMKYAEEGTELWLNNAGWKIQWRTACLWCRGTVTTGPESFWYAHRAVQYKFKGWCLVSDRLSIHDCRETWMEAALKKSTHIEKNTGMWRFEELHLFLHRCWRMSISDCRKYSRRDHKVTKDWRSCPKNNTWWTYRPFLLETRCQGKSLTKQIIDNWPSHNEKFGWCKVSLVLVIRIGFGLGTGVKVQAYFVCRSNENLK